MGLDDLGGPADDRQDVVEIVGDACRERAQGGHFLTVDQLLGGQLQLARALGDDLLDPRMTVAELDVAVDGYARKK